MFFGCTVVSTMTRARSPGFIAPVLVATARLSCNSACNRSSPMRLRQWVIEERSERKPVLEKFLAAEVLVIRVLDPQFTHDLVAEVIGVLENGEPRHQPRRQRRLAWAIAVNGTEFLFQKSPVDRPRQLHQRVVHVDDLIEPRTKQILPAALPSLPWPHRNPPLITLSSRESRLQIRGNPPT